MHKSECLVTHEREESVSAKPFHHTQAILDHNEGAVSLIDGKGRTALHYACAEGSADCVRTLLSYKTSVLACTKSIFSLARD